MDENGVPIGPSRVWLKSEPIPGLAMTRSFGDQIAATIGLTADPGNIQLNLILYLKKIYFFFN